MKQLKKTLLALLCVGVLFGMTACGSDNTANDNAVNDATEGNNTEQDRTDRNQDTNNDGVLEDVGRGVDNGVRDVVDGVEEGVEDMTGQDDTDRANHAETPNRGKTER